MHLIPYNSYLYEQLMSFLVENFLHRDRKYLEWGLMQSTNVKEELLSRTFL